MERTEYDGFVELAAAEGCVLTQSEDTEERVFAHVVATKDETEWQEWTDAQMQEWIDERKPNPATDDEDTEERGESGLLSDQNEDTAEESQDTSEEEPESPEPIDSSVI